MTQIQNIEGAIAEGTGKNRTYALRDALNPGALLFSEELNRQLEEPRVDRDQSRGDEEAEATERSKEDDLESRTEVDADRVKEYEADNRPLVAADVVPTPSAAPPPESLTTQAATAVAPEAIRKPSAETVTTPDAKPVSDQRTAPTETNPRVVSRPEAPTVAAQEADRTADPTVTDPVRQLRQGRTDQVPTTARPDVEESKVEVPREEIKKDAAEAPRVRAETESRAAEKADRKEPTPTERSLRAQTAEVRNQQQSGERTQRTTGRANTVPSPSTGETSADTRTDSKPSDNGALSEAQHRTAQASGAGTKSAQGTHTSDPSASTSATIAGVQASGSAGGTQAAANPNQPAGVLGVSSANAAKGSSAARPAQKAFQASRPVPVDRILTQVRHAVRGGVQDIKIRLDPPELGRLNLRLQMDGDSLTVTVRASSPEVAAALRSELSSFHDTLKDAGIDLTSLDIDIESDDPSTERGLAQGDRDGDGHPQRDEANGENESTTSGSSTGKRRSPLGGMLDVTA